MCVCVCVCVCAQNNKDYFDQSLDEIKLLKYVNTQDPEDKWGIVRLYDYFYYKVRGVCKSDTTQTRTHTTHTHRHTHGMSAL